MYLINYIAQTDKQNIVIKDEGDRTKIEAIERLSLNFDDEKEVEWRINASLEKDTLLIY